MPIRYGSVCSGIEAATAAWRPLGWEAAWFSEIEQFPCDLLAQKYPEVENLGDMTKIAARVRAGEVEAPDVLCGGTPCQAFSWAGKRASLDDARGQLSLAYADLFNAIDERRKADGREPAVCFWENVPGVLSTKDNAFGCFLGALVGADEPVDAPGGWSKAGCVEGPQRRAAWRVLDAQYFGLAQRRKRVFVVASARDGFDPAEVLFELEGLRWGAEAGEAGRQGAAGGAEGRAGADRGAGGRPVVLNDQGGANISVEAAGLSPTLTAQQHGHQPCVISYWCRPDRNSRPVDVSTTLDRNYASPTAHQGGIALVECFAGGNVQADYRPSTAATTLDRNAADIRVGRSSGTAIVQTVVPQLHGGSMIEDDKAGTLRSRCVFMGGGGDAALAVVQTVSVQGYGAMREDDKANTLRARCCFTIGGDSALAIERGAEHQFAVRRLTVTECERLMGFPDGYTRISYRGKPAGDCPDTPRYAALGNSWAVPVVRWIGERLQLQMREANYGDS